MDSVSRFKISDPVESISSSLHIRKVPFSKEVAIRINQMALLKFTQDLSFQITKDWNALDSEELAEKIIQLEDKVALLEGSTKEIAKIKKQTERLHFTFVYPIALEMNISKDSEFPSFASEIQRLLNKVLNADTLNVFNELSGTQKQEIMRYAQEEV